MTTTLRELLDARVREHPDTVAVSGAGTTLTWASLRDAARGVASGLVTHGIRAQDRVVFIGKNDPRYFAVLFGCGLAAAVLTPLNWRLAPHELAEMVEDSGAGVLVVDEHGATAVEAIGDGLPPGCTVVTLDGHERWPSLAEFSGPAEDPGVPALAQHVAFQLYTSGTTGRPKGAMFANEPNLRVLLEDISRAWDFTGDDVSLVCMPLFHMGGLAWALCGMARGARTVVVRDFVPGEVLDTMEREAVTLAFCVPTMLSALCVVPSVGDRRLALRQMVYSGSPIQPAALHRAMAALGCDFVQIYGLTEATGAFAQLSAAEHRADADDPGALSSAGRPYPWVHVRVVDPSTLEDVAAGGVGEIWTRSEQNMVGYWRRPEETAQSLQPDNWLRTGDLGHLGPGGHIHLVDRAKDLVITGGENVYPAQVERVLSTHPDIAEVAVIGVPDERWGETVKAIAVAETGVVLDSAQVIAFARERMASFTCPTSVDQVDALPRTATGKVIKPVLREPYWHGHDRRVH